MTDLTSFSRTELVAGHEQANARLAAVTADIEAIKAEMAGRLKSLTAEQQRLSTLASRFSDELARREAMDAMVPTISDHALLRYIERVCGVDIAALKAELLTDAVVLAIKSGASAVKSPHGTMVIKGSTVVTFKDADMDRPRRAPKGKRYHEAPDDEEVS